MALGIFAGFIAPFGGFFASGVKRAFKIKDFGDSIPGHGGMTDRMDCQLMMGMFTCLWISNFVLSSGVNVQSILQQAITLSDQEYVQLIQELISAKPGIKFWEWFTILLTLTISKNMVTLFTFLRHFYN